MREYLIEPVILHRLVGREYRQVPDERPDDREWRAYSEQLGLYVVVRADDEGYKVRLYDPLQRRIIPTAMELAEQAAELEARLRDLEAKVQQREERGK